MSGGSCYVRRDCSTLPQAAWRSKEIAHRHVRSCVDSLWLGCHIYNPSPPVPLSDFRTRCVRPVGKFAHLGSNAPPHHFQSLFAVNPSLGCFKCCHVNTKCRRKPFLPHKTMNQILPRPLPNTFRDSTNIFEEDLRANECPRPSLSLTRLCFSH